MKMELNRYELRIIPETDMDYAYLEDTIGCSDKCVDSPIYLKYNYIVGTDKLAYLSTSKSSLPQRAVKEPDPYKKEFHSDNSEDDTSSF